MALRGSPGGSEHVRRLTRALRLHGVLRGFRRFYEGSTGGALRFSKVLRRLYGALRVALGVFAGFTSALRSSTGNGVCFRMFYEGSTELCGWCCVFSEVLRGFYGALRVVMGFLSFTEFLRSSTRGTTCFRRFYEGYTELYG